MMIQVWCKEEDIEIPGGRIEGPDPGLEGKEFVALLTVNNKEKVAALVISSKKIYLFHTVVAPALPYPPCGRGPAADQGLVPPPRRARLGGGEADAARHEQGD